MKQPQPDHAPYAPARGYLVPLVSLALSLPPLLILLGVALLAAYHALTGQNFDTSAPPTFVSPLAFGLAVCYIVLGPFAAVVLCLTQRTRAEQTYGSALLLGYRMKRLNTMALYSAGLAIGVIVLFLCSGLVFRMGT